MSPEIDVRSDGIRIVLPETPSEAWFINVTFADGEPHFTALTYTTTGSTSRRARTFHPPVDRLIGIWCLFRGLNLDGTPIDQGRNLWSALYPPQQIDLGRKPDPRPYGAGDGKDGEASNEYKVVMDEWTRPIADVIHAATLGGLPVRKEVMRAFGVKDAVAKKYITLAYRWNRRYNPGDYPPILGVIPDDQADYGTDPDTWPTRSPTKKTEKAKKKEIDK